VNLGPIVNYAGNDAGPALSFDGSTLYFQSDRPGGFGQYDLHVTTRARSRD
jgi:Tol biopolymer transport system component